ncbi:MAG: hypothetical protein ACRCTI_03475 [Beijerinckiaceae bacterium]
MVLIIAMGVMACSIVPAMSDERMRMSPRITFVDGEARKPCECRARGQVFITGEEICLNGQVSICAMDQNVTTWRGTGRMCPQS